MIGRLSESDHILLDDFLGYVLDRYKNGTIRKTEAIGKIAHLVAAVTLPDGDDWRGYMKAIIEDENA